MSLQATTMTEVAAAACVVKVVPTRCYLSGSRDCVTWMRYISSG